MEEGRKKVSITQGMANAMKGNTARVCSSCSLSVPKYPGRYPSTCPSCGGKLVKCRGEKKVYNESEAGTPVVPVSFVPRIQRVIEGGVVGEVAGDDPACSRVRTVPFKRIAETVPGGVRGLQMFLEQAPNGRLYRMEGVADPILIFDFDAVNERLMVWATEEPKRVLGFDPRESVVDEALPAPASIGSVSGAAKQVTRKSTLNPNRPEGAHRAVGGTRFEIGHNRNEKGRTDIQRSLQNTRNSRRGLAGRLRAAREFHASSDGQRMHRDLARFNTGNHKGQPLGPGSPSHRRTFGQLPAPTGTGYRESVEEDVMPLNEGPGPSTSGPGILPTQGGAYPEQETLDDLLDACLRKLITIESQDILQDIEVTREGAIFFYFDPSVTEQEIAEVLQALQQADQTIQLVGTPDARLQGEQYPAQWWVFSLPAKPEKMLPGPPEAQDEPAQDEPPPEDAPGANEPPKQQTVVQGKTAVDHIADEIDTTKLVYSVGESVLEIAPMDEAAADEILRQLRASGPFVHGTWGAKNIYSFEGGKGLQFDARGKRVLVKLNGHDLYDITFGSTRGLQWKVLKELKDIDAENLARVIDDFLMRGR